MLNPTAAALVEFVPRCVAPNLIVGADGSGRVSPWQMMVAADCNRPGSDCSSGDADDGAQPRPDGNAASVRSLHLCGLDSHVPDAGQHGREAGKANGEFHSVRPTDGPWRGCYGCNCRFHYGVCVCSTRLCDGLSDDRLALQMGSILQLGGTWRLFAIWAIAMTPFTMATWEEYYTGSLVLAELNGPSDGQFILAVCCLLPAVFGTPA